MLVCLKHRIRLRSTIVVATSAPNFQTKPGKRARQKAATSDADRPPLPKPDKRLGAQTPAPQGASQQEWLAKALASAGVASRRNCIDLVKRGQVKVNGKVVTEPATKVDTSTDALEVQGKQLLAQSTASELVYFAVNKPTGYICSNVSKTPGKRAVDLLQPWLVKWQQEHKGRLPPRLFTVGRLDVATSGLIFLTNDGDWANKVIHPSANITKEYWVTLPQPPTQQQLHRLRAGTTIEGVHVTPKIVKVLQPAGQRSQGKPTPVPSKQDGRCMLRIDVSEGKKHEVRLLVAAAGLQLLALKRVRVGGWVMPNTLQAGSFIKLQLSDLKKLLKQP